MTRCLDVVANVFLGRSSPAYRSLAATLAVALLGLFASTAREKVGWQLIPITPATGAGTLVAPIAPAIGANGLGFNPITGKLYTWDGNKFYELNKATAATVTTITPGG